MKIKTDYENESNITNLEIEISNRLRFEVRLDKWDNLVVRKISYNENQLMKIVPTNNNEIKLS